MNSEQHKQLIEEINLHTAEVVRQTVNGKIDEISKAQKLNTEKITKIDDALCMLSESFSKHCKVVEPIITTFNDRKGFFNTISQSGKIVGIFGGIIVGLGVIITFFINAFTPK